MTTREQETGLAAVLAEKLTLWFYKKLRLERALLIIAERGLIEVHRGGQAELHAALVIGLQSRF